MEYERNINGQPVVYIIQHEHETYRHCEHYFVGVLPTRQQAETYHHWKHDSHVIYEFNMNTGDKIRLYYLMHQEKLKNHLVNLFTKGEMRDKCEALDVYSPFDQQLDFNIKNIITGI